MTTIMRTEAPLVVRPYLARMLASLMSAVLAGLFVSLQAP
jgi:nucleoside permease NupC